MVINLELELDSSGIHQVGEGWLLWMFLKTPLPVAFYRIPINLGLYYNNHLHQPKTPGGMAWAPSLHKGSLPDGWMSCWICLARSGGQDDCVRIHAVHRQNQDCKSFFTVCGLNYFFPSIRKMAFIQKIYTITFVFTKQILSWDTLRWIRVS